MNERCQDCPKRILAEPRIKRVERTYDYAKEQLKQLDEQIDECTVWDILKGARRRLRDERDGFRSRTFSPAATDHILVIGEKYLFDNCEGPFVRTSPINEDANWQEIACGTSVRSSYGGRIDTENQPTV